MGTDMWREREWLHSYIFAWACVWMWVWVLIQKHVCVWLCVCDVSYIICALLYMKWCTCVLCMCGVCVCVRARVMFTCMFHSFQFFKDEYKAYKSMVCINNLKFLLWQNSASCLPVCCNCFKCLKYLLCFVHFAIAFLFVSGFGFAFLGGGGRGCLFGWVFCMDLLCFLFSQK